MARSDTPPDHTGQIVERLLTPSKITAWLDCAHFLTLQHQIDAGTLVVERSPFGEMAQLLLAKGMDHEAAVLDGYRAEGKSVFVVPEQDKEHGESFEAWVERVGNPMADGHDVVFQMPFVHDGIRGIADFLVRTVDPDTGAVSYEPVDAKLARNEAKPGHVLQLCFYAEALGALTGARPDARAHLPRFGSGRDDPRRPTCCRTGAACASSWPRWSTRRRSTTPSPSPATTASSASSSWCVRSSGAQADSLVYVAGVRPADRLTLRAGHVGRSPAWPRSTVRSTGSTKDVATGSSARPRSRSPPASTPTTRRRSSC